MKSDQQQGLSRAAERSRRSPAFVASLFERWEKAFETTVAASLGVDSAQINSLGLCLRPREDHWAQDIDEIASACGLEPGKLGAMLRQALVAERLAASPPLGDVVDGRLLAARDRDEDKEE
jgi:hypothetical protein